MIGIKNLSWLVTFVVKAIQLQNNTSKFVQGTCYSLWLHMDAAVLNLKERERQNNYGSRELTF